MSRTDSTPVVFRKWPGTGGVIALFPTLPSDIFLSHCTSYMRLGQHGGANYSYVVECTQSATPEEYAELKQELEELGYTLKVVARATAAMHEERRQAGIAALRRG